MPGLSAIASAIGLKGFAAIGMALAFAAMFWLNKHHTEQLRDAQANLALADAQITLLKTDAALKETASKERQDDNAAIDAAEKELVNAISQVPDSQPDAVRVRLGCERLRAANPDRLDADLPAVCRPSGGTETHTPR